MRDLDDLFDALANSAFRRKQRLNAKDQRYLASRPLDQIMSHARDFIVRRLAPAHPPNDGKQTPMRGHPVFVAQHATATCCRGCLEKWHNIARGHTLEDAEVDHVLNTIGRWLDAQDLSAVRPDDNQPTLFDDLD